VATYKVLQDIEAEDKLIGPLTLRQFIYAGIAVLCGYLIFLLASKGAAAVAVIFLPPMAICAFFAFPWTKDQPTEVWALARIRFYVKPRKRIWDQTGIKELVTVTAPKQVNQNYTNGLTEGEVRSRLRALADTIDSRGWAIKNVSVNMYGQPALIMNEPTSDRLVAASSMPQPVSDIDIQPSDDILDETHNPRAAQVESKLEQSSKARRQRVMDEMKVAPQPPQPAPGQQNNYWFLNQPSQTATSVPSDAVTFNTQVITPGVPITDVPAVAATMPVSATPTDDEEQLLRELEEQRKAQENVSTYSHLHTIQPLSVQQQQEKAVAEARAKIAAAQAQQARTQAAVPEPAKPAILDLANNDDLNVATIAREANKRRELPDDEVVISLH
jgi:hypothetical protein